MSKLVPAHTGAPAESDLSVRVQTVGRVRQAVFANAEQGLGVGVVVRDPGATVRGHDAESVPRGVRRRALHRPAVADLQDQRPVWSALTQHSTLKDEALFAAYSTSCRHAHRS